MKEEEPKFMTAVGYTLAIAIVGASICGILECFNINTGAIGAIFGIITSLPIPTYLVYVLIKWIDEQKKKGVF